jgi:class 3 adenylate cyclase/tetratricopeptide (TPR) repeat protein
MRCPRCQHENRPQAKFCEECATPLARTCSNCGTALSPTAKFCPECAHPVVTGNQPGFGSPETYTPKHLAEKILTSKAALEGERKQVTVLFADMKGSMELLANRDPEQARKILDPVLELMMEAVHRYEGTVNQVMGDGIMALFGAPLAHEDHAVRACYAALDMQAAVRRYDEGVHRSHDVGAQIRIGLNSGEVVVRAIGSDLRMDYSAIGQTTHLAARLEQLANPGYTLLTTGTLRLAEGYVEVRPIGPVPVKGVENPIDVYEMVGTGPLRSRLHAAEARGLTPLVGRESELDLLRQALGRAAAGRGQIMVLVGEAGVGKSRLVWEVTHSHRTHGWLILESRSVSYGKATPYLPVISLLKGYLAIQDRDNHDEVRQKVSSKLRALDETLEPTAAALLSLLDVPVQDLQWQTLEPPQRRQRTLDAMKRLLLRESQAQPLLLVFEDLHWIDSETQAFLDSLVESLPTARILLLVNYRPEYQDGWVRKTYYTRLRLDALAPEDTEDFLRALIGVDPALHPLNRLLMERTDGNPFFLEESVRTLVETKALVGERGAYRLAAQLPSVQVPATVQAVLAARIDRLPAEEKWLLQCAAVIGKDVPARLLQTIADEPEEVVGRQLAHLRAAEFLYEARLFPDLEYTFKHALTHEVAYGSLLHDRRRSLHTRIMEAIEHLDPDRLRDHIDQLAHHAFKSEVWGKAVTYLRQAGAKAASRSANREAIAHLEHALVALGHLPESPETLAQAIDLRFDLRNSLHPLGEFERVFGYLQEADRLARKLDDRRRLGWVSMYMSHYFWMVGTSTEVRTFAETALAIAEPLQDFQLQVAANFYLGGACLTTGDYRRAEDLFRKIGQSLEGDFRRDRFGLAGFPAVLSRSMLTWSLAERGEFSEGIAQAQEGIRLAEALDHPYSLILAYWGLGSLYGVKGELSDARRVLERGLALSREWNLPLVSPRVMWPLGYVYAHSGRVAEGVSLLEEALRAVESIGLRSYRSLIVVHLGEACVLADRLVDALALARRALAQSRERGERGYEARALHLLGEITSHGDPLDAQQAEGYHRQAMALATDLGMRPLVGHCHLSLGKLYRRMGKREQAQGNLRTATTMYREMDMRFWLEQTEAEIGLLG